MEIDDLDIYHDLDDFEEAENKKTNEFKELESKYTVALQTIETLKMENKDLNKTLKIIQVNFQNLLDTAKAEIKRKDKQIQELRREYDDICFRRKPPPMMGGHNFHRQRDPSEHSHTHQAQQSSDHVHQHIEHESTHKDLDIIKNDAINDVAPIPTELCEVILQEKPTVPSKGDIDMSNDRRSSEYQRNDYREDSGKRQCSRDPRLSSKVEHQGSKYINRKRDSERDHHYSTDRKRHKDKPSSWSPSTSRPNRSDHSVDRKDRRDAKSYSDDRRDGNRKEKKDKDDRRHHYESRHEKHDTRKHDRSPTRESKSKMQYVTLCDYDFHPNAKRQKTTDYHEKKLSSYREGEENNARLQLIPPEDQINEPKEKQVKLRTDEDRIVAKSNMKANVIRKDVNKTKFHIKFKKESKHGAKKERNRSTSETITTNELDGYDCNNSRELKLDNNDDVVIITDATTANATENIEMKEETNIMKLKTIEILEDIRLPVVYDIANVQVEDDGSDATLSNVPQNMAENESVISTNNFSVEIIDDSISNQKKLNEIVISPAPKRVATPTNNISITSISHQQKENENEIDKAEDVLKSPAAIECDNVEQKDIDVSAKLDPTLNNGDAKTSITDSDHHALMENTSNPLECKKTEDSSSEDVHSGDVVEQNSMDEDVIYPNKRKWYLKNKRARFLEVSDSTLFDCKPNSLECKKICNNNGNMESDTQDEDVIYPIKRKWYLKNKRARFLEVSDSTLFDCKPNSLECKKICNNNGNMESDTQDEDVIYPIKRKWYLKNKRARSLEVSDSILFDCKSNSLENKKICNSNGKMEGDTREATFKDIHQQRIDNNESQYEKTRNDSLVANEGIRLTNSPSNCQSSQSKQIECENALQTNNPSTNDGSNDEGNRNEPQIESTDEENRNETREDITEKVHQKSHGINGNETNDDDDDGDAMKMTIEDSTEKCIQISDNINTEQSHDETMKRSSEDNIGKVTDMKKINEKLHSHESNDDATMKTTDENTEIYAQTSDNNTNDVAMKVTIKDDTGKRKQTNEEINANATNDDTMRQSIEENIEKTTKKKRIKSKPKKLMLLNYEKSIINTNDDHDDDAIKQRIENDIEVNTMPTSKQLIDNDVNYKMMTSIKDDLNDSIKSPASLQAVSSCSQNQLQIDDADIERNVKLQAATTLTENAVEFIVKNVNNYFNQNDNERKRKLSQDDRENRETIEMNKIKRIETNDDIAAENANQMVCTNNIENVEESSTNHIEKCRNTDTNQAPRNVLLTQLAEELQVKSVNCKDIEKSTTTINGIINSSNNTSNITAIDEESIRKKTPHKKRKFNEKTFVSNCVSTPIKNKIASSPTTMVNDIFEKSINDDDGGSQTKSKDTTAFLPQMPANISQDEQFNEIDSRMRTMFESPSPKLREPIIPINTKEACKPDTTVTTPLTSITPSNNESQTDLSSITIDETINDSSQRLLEDSTQSDVSLSYDVKHISLGSSDYRFERVSDNVINLFITRHRKKKKKKTKNNTAPDVTTTPDTTQS